MNPGTENRKKTIIAGALGVVALLCILYAYNALFGGYGAPPPSVAPVSAPVRPAAASSTPTQNAAATAASRPAAMPSGNAAGVAAKKMATTSASLDPSLDQSAMLRTEHLVYAGSGRNIFSAVYVPEVKIPKPVASVRVKAPLVVPCPPNCPPPPPPPPPAPIPLKFFGTATHSDGNRQAFLLQGDNVFLAGKGDIVSRRYRIVSINPNSIVVEDMVNSNTQTLPLQSN